MIKFRCLNCSQKIAVNDVGIGVIIACPTCAHRLIVPPCTDYEFQREDLVPVEHDLAPTVTESQREALIPHLAKLMMNKLVQGLLFQRREMLQTQEEATEQIAAIEQRLALIHTKMQRRIQYYEDRITQLNADVEAKNLENQKLQERCRQLATMIKPMPLGTPPRFVRSKLPNDLLVGS